MNKQKFINLLHDFDNIADHERNKLHELAMNYPYSQIIHTLVAKANNDARTEIAAQTLNYAAMYATDRNVLKSIIQHAANSSKIKAAVSPQKNNVAAGKNVTGRLTIRPDVDLEADHLRKEVWLDLAALKKSKASYMAWAAEESVSDKTTNKTSGKKSQIAPAKSSSATITKKEKIKKKTAKEKSEVKKSKAKALKPKTAAKKPEKEVSKPSKSKQSPAPHEEQKKLIDNFISKEPRLSARPLKVSENQPDLSESSTAFNEDLVSENLAQIFIDQGKQEKAIDIYKKLIWKFPQKKAYFASRIEELKK